MTGQVKFETIVAKFNTYSVDMRLTSAFALAADISTLFQDYADERYNEGYKRGKEANQYNIEDAAYQRGYDNGKIDGARQAENSDEKYELKRLQRMEQLMIMHAREISRGIIEETGRDKKIACIKALRAVTQIGLKDAKDIIDATCKILDEETAWAEKEKREKDGFTETDSE